MFLCCNGQSVAEFEKAHAIPVDPALLESKREKQGKKSGDGVLTEVDTRPKGLKRKQETDVVCVIHT